MSRLTFSEASLKVMQERISGSKMSVPVSIPVNKYSNKKNVVDGLKFDSKKESSRYLELKMMQRGGLISDLKMQVPFELEVNGVLICKYVADFTYLTNDDKRLMVVEDSKGFRTPEYKLKKKLMNAIHGIEIKET